MAEHWKPGKGIRRRSEDETVMMERPDATDSGDTSAKAPDVQLPAPPSPGMRAAQGEIPAPPAPTMPPRWQKPDPARAEARRQQRSSRRPAPPAPVVPPVPERPARPIQDPADADATRILPRAERRSGEQRDFFYFDPSLDGRLDEINATIATRREELKQGLSDESLIRLRTDIQQLLIELQPTSDRLQKDAEAIQAKLYGSAESDDHNARAIRVPQEYRVIIAQNRKVYETLRALRVQFENIQRMRGEIGNVVGESRSERLEEYMVPGDADEAATTVYRATQREQEWQPPVPGGTEWRQMEDAPAKMFRRKPGGGIEWIEPGQGKAEQGSSVRGEDTKSFWDRIGGLFGGKKKKKK